MQVNDFEREDGSIARRQGVLVERCSPKTKSRLCTKCSAMSCAPQHSSLTVSLDSSKGDHSIVSSRHEKHASACRCRYLEETGCASVCLNSCKVPTQEFFEKDMGLPLTMAPNYEDFSCQFSFGMAPRLQAQDDAFQTPCFLQCPSKRRHSAAQKCPGASTL